MNTNMMFTPPLGAHSNGHLSPGDEMNLILDNEARPTDNDSPEAYIPPSNRSSPPPSDDANEASNHFDNDQQMSESEAASEDNASEDADFDMEESLPSQNDDALEDHASSTDSTRAPKRKLPAAEDEFIKANPELYGLRRSVRPENFSPDEDFN